MRLLVTLAREAHTRPQGERGGSTKFVTSHATRPGGTAAENVASVDSAQKLLARLTPSPTAAIREWVQRCDRQGGFAVVDLNDATTAATQDALGTARAVA